MKILLSIILLYIPCALVLVSPMADGDKPAPLPAPVIRQVSAEFADGLQQADALLTQRDQELKSSAVYQGYVAAQAIRRERINYILAKIGGDPDSCREVYDQKTGRVAHFECAPAVPQKDK